MSVADTIRRSQILDAILAYLDYEFPNFRVEPTVQQGPPYPHKFAIEDKNPKPPKKRYILEVDQSRLSNSSITAEMITRLLQDDKVADKMRKKNGSPFTW
jgi:hypothetical protein